MAILWLAGFSALNIYADQAVDDPSSFGVPPPPGLDWATPANRLPQRSTRMSDTNTSFRASTFPSMPARPGDTLTNKTDFVQQALLNSVTSYEHELANPGLDPILRKTFERLLEERKRQLADHQTNAQLWINVRQAEQSKDLEKASMSKQELADYLAARLGKIQGKTYPEGTSLDAIIDEYQKQTDGSRWFGGRAAIYTIIFAACLIPLLIMIFTAIKKRISK